MVTSCWLGTCLWTVPHPEAAYRFRLRWADEALCGFIARWPAHRQLVTTGWASVMAHNHARFSDAERQRSPAAGSGSGGRVDRERGHCCLFSRSLSKLLVSLSISSSFPVDDIHSGQVSVHLAPFAFQISSTCHPSPCNGFSPSPTTMMAP